MAGLAGPRLIAVLARLMTWIRPGFVTDPAREPRLTAHAVMVLTGAMPPGMRQPGPGGASATVQLVQGRLIWTVCVTEAGRTTCRTVDDETEALGPVWRFGQA